MSGKIVFLSLIFLYFFYFYEKEGERMIDCCLAGHNAGLKSDMVSRALRRTRESAISSPSFFLILGPEASFITADIQISGWNTEKPAMAPPPRPTSQSHAARIPLSGRD